MTIGLKNWTSVSKLATIFYSNSILVSSVYIVFAIRPIAFELVYVSEGANSTGVRNENEYRFEPIGTVLS